jgi:hypothetical protein
MLDNEVEGKSIYTRRFRGDGAPVSGAAPLHPGSTATAAAVAVAAASDGGWLAVAAAPNGTAMVVWSDELQRVVARILAAQPGCARSHGCR